jgi:hypothetical protein
VDVSITLNLPYTLSPADWAKVATVYESMDGWIGYDQVPFWYGREGDVSYIIASVEPSGLLLEGHLDPRLWTGWLTTLCARLSLALGREVRDAEM